MDNRIASKFEQMLGNLKDLHSFKFSSQGEQNFSSSIEKFFNEKGITKVDDLRFNRIYKFIYDLMFILAQIEPTPEKTANDMAYDMFEAWQDIQSFDTPDKPDLTDQEAKSLIEVAIRIWLSQFES